jgi:ribonuclease HI
MVRLAEKYLEIYHAGVQVELRWVPGHSGNHGNQRAHILARRAAKSGYKKAPPACVAVLRASGMRMREIVMGASKKARLREPF